MKCLNRHSIIGYLGKDAETRFTPSGVAVISFSVATSEKWTDKSTGEIKERTDWHNCVLWRAENLAQYLVKGKPVYLEGRSETQSWEKDGQKHYKTQIVVDSLTLLGGGNGGGPRDDEAPPPRNRGDIPTSRQDDAPPHGDEDAPF